MAYTIEALPEKNIQLGQNFNCQSRRGKPIHSVTLKIIKDVLKLISRRFLVFEGQEIVDRCPFAEESMRHFRGAKGYDSSTGEVS